MGNNEGRLLIIELRWFERAYLDQTARFNYTFPLCRVDTLPAVFNMSPSEGGKPVVLLLGEVVLAQAEWNSLTAIAELRVCRRLSL